MITLTRDSLPTPLLNQHTWPIKITAVSTTTGIPSEIFVYKQGQSGVAGAEAGDVFECVASVAQLNELGLQPLDVESRHIPFFRKAVVQFDCRSAEEALQLWEEIQADVADLSRNFAAASSLSVQDSVEI